MKWDQHLFPRDVVYGMLLSRKTHFHNGWHQWNILVCTVSGASETSPGCDARRRCPDPSLPRPVSSLVPVNAWRERLLSRGSFEKYSSQFRDVVVRSPCNDPLGPHDSRGTFLQHWQENDSKMQGREFAHSPFWSTGKISFPGEQHKHKDNWQTFLLANALNGKPMATLSCFSCRFSWARLVLFRLISVVYGCTCL